MNITPSGLHVNSLDANYPGFEQYPQAAVLALLLPGDEPSLLMIEKAAHLRRHAGEVAFPGGKIEAGETHLETAVRECEEEVNVSPDQYDIYGTLFPRLTRHKVAVHPFLGVLKSKPVLTIDKGEVEQAFWVPLATLQAPENFRARRAEIDGELMDLCYFQYGDKEIWGVTAQIIRELLHINPKEQGHVL